MKHLPKAIFSGARDDEPAIAVELGRAYRNASQILVWDLGVRLFHWLLVGTVLAALITGYFAPAPWLNLHIVFGTAVAALIVFRLVWGFAGSTYARFASFVVGPGAVVSYLKRLLAGRTGRHIGHNPLGAMMIVALLLVLGLLTITGLLVLGGELKQGPLAPFTRFATGRSAKEIHEILAFGMLGLIVLHVAGVMIEGFRTRESLVKAMLTGRKEGASLGAAAAAKRAHPRVAAAVLVLAVTAAVPSIIYAARLPGLGVPTAALDPVYAKECGACHTAYHPSLAPAAAWHAIIAGLDDHFNDNASLDPAQSARLLAYLTANSAEHWDTKPSIAFRTPDVTEPLRITASPAWKRIHRDVPETAFGAKAVGGKLNCAACHSDASRGHFAPQAIAVPKEKITP